MLTTFGRKNGHVWVEITSLKEYTKVTGFSTFSAKKQNSAKKKKSNHHIHKLMRARSLARARERERERERERREREKRERREREREKACLVTGKYVV